MEKTVAKGMILLLTGFSVLLISCEKKDSKADSKYTGNVINIPISASQKEVIDSSGSFAFTLFRQILSGSKGNENIMISPFSISSALSMTLNGAAGDTYDDLNESLDLDGKSLDWINSTYHKLMTEMIPVDKQVSVGIGNSVWVEKSLPVKPEFVTDLITWYSAEAHELNVSDPAAVKTVNNWIAEKTNDKITEMLDNLDPGMKMLLINAICFKGKWKYGFDKSATTEKSFYISPSTFKSTPMMYLARNLKAVRSDNFSIVELPYGQGNYTMVIALPDKNMTIMNAVNSLNFVRWNNWMNLLSDSKHFTQLYFPRFKYQYNRTLNNDLISLGMGKAFSDQADFSNISPEFLKISRVMHQTAIENNEEGTEAEAATVVEFVYGAPNPASAETVNVDHPFLFFIRESSTGTILFMGLVQDPTIN